MPLAGSMISNHYIIKSYKEKKLMTVVEKPINDEEFAKLWDAFKVFDTDGSGEITATELGKVMQSLGKNPTEAELKKMIHEVDINFSGTIDFEEFKTLMISKMGDHKSRLELAFSVFDRDGSGYIALRKYVRTI